MIFSFLGFLVELSSLIAGSNSDCLLALFQGADKFNSLRMNDNRDVQQLRMIIQQIDFLSFSKYFIPSLIPLTSCKQNMNEDSKQKKFPSGSDLGIGMQTKNNAKTILLKEERKNFSCLFFQLDLNILKK